MASLVTCYLIDEILISQGTTFAVWFGKVLAYSKINDGVKAYMTDSRACAELGIDERTARRCAKKAEELGLVKYAIEPFTSKGKSGKHRVYYIQWNNRLLSDIDIGLGHSSPQSGAVKKSASKDAGKQNSKIKAGKMSASDTVKKSAPHTDKMSAEYTEDKNTEINTDTAQQAAPRAPFPPKNADQVLECMKSQAAKHPEWHADALNLKEQAAQLFEYYEDNGWRAATGNALRSLRNAVSSWLPRAVKEKNNSAAPRPGRRDQTAELRHSAFLFSADPANSKETIDAEVVEIGLVADGSKK